jgi:hypothetical protein
VASRKRKRPSAVVELDREIRTTAEAESPETQWRLFLAHSADVEAELRAILDDAPPHDEDSAKAAGRRAAAEGAYHALGRLQGARSAAEDGRMVEALCHLLCALHWSLPPEATAAGLKSSGAGAWARMNQGPQGPRLRAIARQRKAEPSPRKAAILEAAAKLRAGKNGRRYAANLAAAEKLATMPEGCGLSARQLRRILDEHR